MRIIFVYNSKCARTTLKKVLNNGGLYITLNYSFFYISQLRRSGVFSVSFEYISHLFLVFLLLALNRKSLAGMSYVPRET